MKFSTAPGRRPNEQRATGLKSWLLAQSGWQTRDYCASQEAGGCGTPGERTCVLVDEDDLSQVIATI